MSVEMLGTLLIMVGVILGTVAAILIAIRIRRRRNGSRHATRPSATGLGRGYSEWESIVEPEYRRPVGEPFNSRRR